MEIFIEVDYREKDVGILEVLGNAEGLVVEETHLPIGDYRISNHQKHISL